MSDSVVTYAVDGKVGVISMNRPQKLNAISQQLRIELVEAFRRADQDPATSVVILRAEGRSFCVGYDIGGLAGESDPERAKWKHDALRWHQYLSECVRFEMAPWDMRKPVVAAVQGHALGGGCELAMFCDLTIAADDAIFGEPEIRFSDAGPGIVMPWIIGLKRARELLYFGDSIDAGRALEIGMVNRVVPRAELDEAALRYARRLALIAPEALVATKLSINRGAEAGGFRSAILNALDVVAPLYAARTEVGEQFRSIAEKDGIGAALKWRAGQFRE